MMFSTIFLASLVGMLFCTVDGKKNSVRKLHFYNEEKNVPLAVSLAAPNHLRQETISLESSNNYVKMKGFLEDAAYSGMNADGKCVHPQFKFITALNVCGAASDTIVPAPGPYYMYTIYADPTGNTYYYYDQYFSDSTCTMSVTPLTYVGSNYIAICNEFNELYFARDEPMNPATDNLGYTILTYDTSSNCMTNSYQNGLLEAQYGKLNVCLQVSETSTDPTAGDIEFTSCSPTTGLVTTTYSSTDGTCTGTSTSTTLSPSNACLTADAGWYYTGYTNFGCSTVVTTD
jgi:hypothetical protein